MPRFQNDQARTNKPTFSVDDPTLVVYGPGGEIMDTEEALMKDQEYRDANGLPLHRGGINRILPAEVEEIKERAKDRVSMAERNEVSIGGDQ